MATFIEAKGASSSSTSVSLTMTSVQVGDLVAVFCGAFTGGGSDPALWTCTDTLGNVYTPRIWDIGRGFGSAVGFSCKVTVAGSPTITVYNPYSAFGLDRHMCVAQYRDAGDFDQSNNDIGYYQPPAWDGHDYTLGVGTGPFTLADTLVLSFVYHGKDPGSGVVGSNTGDTVLVVSNSGSALLGTLLARNQSGPGSGQVKLTPSGDYGTKPLVTMTFSKPLARPGGLDTQYAVRAGSGTTPGFNYVNGFPQPPGTDGWPNNPLELSLPYIPEVGSMLVVGVAMNVNTAPTFDSVTDSYGNVYTKRGETNGALTSSNRISLWTAPVVGLPPAGQVFKVRMSITQHPEGLVYESATLAVAEKVGYANASLQFAGYDHDVSADPTVTLFSQTLATVPANSYMIAFATYPGEVNQDSIAWAALNSFTLREHWSEIAFHQQIVNRPRMGVAAWSDRIAPADGSYAASTSGTLTGVYGEGGSIALLALTVAPSPGDICAERIGPKIYFWEPSFLERPEDIAMRATDWENNGLEGAKFLQGFILEADTMGQDKVITMQGDWTDLQSFTINHNGQLAKPYVFDPAKIAGLTRLISPDDVEWRYFGHRMIWEPLPELVTYYETQETTHDLPGYQFPKDGYIALISSADVTLTITVDGVAHTYTIPSTGGVHAKQYLIFGINPTTGQTLKGKIYKYTLSSAAGFRLYQKDCEVRMHDWSGGDYVVVHPFGETSRIHGAKI